jgi:hypothetical protein
MATLGVNGDPESAAVIGERKRRNNFGAVAIVGDEVDATRPELERERRGRALLRGKAGAGPASLALANRRNTRRQLAAATALMDCATA